MNGSTTYTALTTLPGEEAAQRLGAALEAALSPTGVGVFEIEDGSGRWEVGGYFLEPPDTTALALLSAAHGAGAFVVSALEDRDWVAQVRRELTPVAVGRIIIHGRHDRARVAENQLPLEIEAAMAFGTGHHGTTEGCLEALRRLLLRGARLRRVADVGCGTGVLAMAATRLTTARGVASDLDPVAVSTARANRAANRRRGPLAVVQAAGFRSQRLRQAGPYDLIFMNILARPLKRLAPDAARAATPGGYVVLSGLLRRQAADVSAAYRAWGFAPAFQVERRGWATLVFRKGRR